MEHGRFYWTELITNNVEQARAFYHDTLGWEFQSMPMENGETYWLVPGDPMPTCGMYQMTGDENQGAADHWLGYISVDDVDARVAKAKDAGATVLQGPFDVPEIGRIATLREPGGAMIGWITPSEGG